jgi:phosphoribosylformylglycinamidine (FGAM) synthase PurS component
VGSVRSGRLFDLHITAQNRTEAEKQADEAARQLLCNTVVETYTVTVEEQ